MDPQIVFENIECASQRQLATDFMEDITRLSPSDAAVRATFHHLHDKFWAEIKIASQSTYMTAFDQATLLGDLLERVKSSLMGQIVDWRTHRFAS